MSNFLVKLKGLLFIAAGFFWLVGVFASLWPSVSASTNDSIVFIVATICGFSVMSFGTSWLNNNTFE